MSKCYLISQAQMDQFSDRLELALINTAQNGEVKDTAELRGTDLFREIKYQVETWKSRVMAD